MMKRLAKAGHKAALAATKVSEKPPPQLAHLMIWYVEIRRQALRGQYFEPIQYSEAIAYLTGHKLEWEAFEFDILFRLDVIWRKAQPKPGDKDGKSR